MQAAPPQPSTTFLESDTPSLEEWTPKASTHRAKEGLSGSADSTSPGLRSVYCFLAPSSASFLRTPLLPAPAPGHTGLQGWGPQRRLRGSSAVPSAPASSDPYLCTPGPGQPALCAPGPGLTRQWGAGPAGRTASAQGRCTCCSSSRNPGPAAPRGGLQPPGASRSRGSSSPVGQRHCVIEGLGTLSGPGRVPPY